MGQQARQEVARVIKAEPGRLKQASASAVLAVLSGAALAPVVASVAGGVGVTAALVALAGVAGNVGGGYLTGVIERAADKIRGKSADAPEPEAIRGTLEGELLAVLERDDADARELRAGLMNLMMSIDRIQDAFGAAGDELRGHLVACFGELARQHEATIEKLDALTTEQRRQGRQSRRQTILAEESLDRLRRLTREQAGRGLAGQPRSGERLPPVRPTLLAPGGAMTVPVGMGWRSGGDVVIGDRVYLILEGLTEERFSADRSVVLRQSQGLQQVPAPGPGTGYVWLRQAQRDRDSAGPRTAISALAAERDLLAGLSDDVRGLPRVAQFATDGALVSLVLGWPASRSRQAACETLDATRDRDAGPMDSWRLFRLFSGLAGLCATLARMHSRGAAHRYLTPAGIIVLDDGRLVLRDLGLAARGPEPGEGPANYQAPEQRRQARYRPGSRTDVYQLAALAYHLIAGCPPLARTPLPVRAQAPGVPERAAAALDAALSPEPAERPDISALGGALRAAKDDLR